MKHLKLFSESYNEYVDDISNGDKLRFTPDDINNVMDIFQDIIDEFDLVKSNYATNINGQWRLFNYHYSLSIWINIDEIRNNNKFFLEIANFKKITICILFTILILSPW